MSIQRLQQKIREKKTPLALGLTAEGDRCGSEDLSRTLYEAGLRVMEAAGDILPAVYLRAESYLRFGPAGLSALTQLAEAGQARGLYVIVDCRAADSGVWLQGIPAADAVTVTPYLGKFEVPEDKAVFAVVRTAGVYGAEVQNLMAGDRRLYQAVGEQLARRGAGLVIETGYSLDIREIRRRAEKAFLIVTGADCESAAYAFDDYGRGALAVDDAIQKASDPGEAARQSVKSMKQWITVL